jgi:adenylate kinase
MHAKRLVMLGPPAAGKGTQGARLAARLGVPHISSGHLLRDSIAAGDPYGIQDVVDSGHRVPDEIVEALLVPALGEGFVLDGYPRTAAQAARLDQVLGEKGLPLDAAVELVLEEDELGHRMAVRAEAEKRADDHPDVFLRRLEDYRHEIPGLREHYDGRLVVVDASGSPDEVFDQMLATLPGDEL